MALQLFKIASAEVATPQASIDFTSIPQGYTDLKLVLSGRTTNGGGYYDGLNIMFNSTSTGWTAKVLNGAGSTVSSLSSTTDRNYVINDQNATSNTFGNLELYIPNYTSSNYKTVSSDMITETNDATNNYMRLAAILWSNTAAVTSINIYDTGKTFAAGTTATLYGVL